MDLRSPTLPKGRFSVGEPIRATRIRTPVQHEITQNRCTFTQYFKNTPRTTPDSKSGKNTSLCRTLMYAFGRQISPQIDPQHREIKREAVWGVNVQPVKTIVLYLEYQMRKKRRTG